MRSVLAGLMIVIALASVVRAVLVIRQGRVAHLDADGVHVVMGIAMAGMLEPGLRVVPDWTWLAVFGTAGAWFAWRALRARLRRRGAGGWYAAPLPHLIECVAMLYMLLPALSTGAGRPRPGMAMAGMATSAPGSPVIAMLLALSMAGCIVWASDGLARQRRLAAETAGDGEVAPRVSAYSKIAMSVAMGYMLFQMA